MCDLRKETCFRITIEQVQPRRGTSSRLKDCPLLEAWAPLSTFQIGTCLEMAIQLQTDLVATKPKGFQVKRERVRWRKESNRIGILAMARISHSHWSLIRYLREIVTSIRFPARRPLRSSFKTTTQRSEDRRLLRGLFLFRTHWTIIGTLKKIDSLNLVSTAV